MRRIALFLLAVSVAAAGQPESVEPEPLAEDLQEQSVESERGAAEEQDPSVAPQAVEEEPEQEPVPVESIDEESQGPVETIGATPQPLPHERREPQIDVAEAKKILAADLKTGQGLVGAGLAAHTIGGAVWLIGVFRGFGVNTYDDLTSVAVQRIVGGTVMGLSPIFACAGHTLVKNSVSDLTREGVWSNVWADFGSGWAFVVGANVVSFVGGMLAVESESVGLLVGTAIVYWVMAGLGEFYWVRSIAHSGSYVRSVQRKFKTGQLRFSVAPAISPRGECGFLLSLDL
jgi:hypothetical protein